MSLSFGKRFAVKALNIISKTWRINTKSPTPETPCVIGFWHGEMLPIWKYFKYTSPIGIVSQSKDGEILSQLLLKWQFQLLRGSSHKGGKEILLKAIKEYKDKTILMTPDGPRGPMHEFKAGAVVIAQRSEKPLYLCRAEIKSKKIFPKAWDKFQLPLPFSKINLHLSPAIHINKDADRSETTAIIENCQKTLNEML